MFRPMRRKKNEISQEAAKQLLQQERRGVFAVNGDDGYPYAIPVNYYLDKELIEEEIQQSGKAVQIYEITIEHLSGKQIQEK